MAFWYIAIESILAILLSNSLCGRFYTINPKTRGLLMGRYILLHLDKIDKQDVIW